MKELNLNTMSLSELHERLKLFGNRGMALCGRTPDGQALGPQVKKFFDELLDSTTNPEKIRARTEFMARAEADPIARRQMCGIRVETINNYILATINITPMFFDIVNLADDERPVIQNTTEQEVNVGYVGADGGVKMVRVDKNDDEVMIPLRYLTTDKVRYRRVDIYRGTIVDAALKVLRLAYDLKNQMDARAYSLLTAPLNSGGAFGNFTFTGKKANYTYLANSRINTAMLPATNDIVCSGNTGTTKFRYQVLREAKRYGDQWSGAFPEGDLMPTGSILIPAKEAADIAEEIVPSGTTNNAVANQLLERGWSTIDYLGMHWTLKTDNTLPGKSCLVELNRKPGVVYLKPSQDREQVRGEEDYNLSQNNEEERWSQKVFGAYINSARRVNVLRITYTT